MESYIMLEMIAQKYEWNFCSSQTLTISFSLLDCLVTNMMGGITLWLHVVCWVSLTWLRCPSSINSRECASSTMAILCMTVKSLKCLHHLERSLNAWGQTEFPDFLAKFLLPMMLSNLSYSPAASRPCLCLAAKAGWVAPQAECRAFLWLCKAPFPGCCPVMNLSLTTDAGNIPQ